VSESSSPRSTADRLLDLCVYAPIGLALEAHKYVPELADRGRNQVALARFVGKLAVDRLEKQFGPLGAFLRTDAPASPSTPPPTADAAPSEHGPDAAVSAEPAASDAAAAESTEAQPAATVTDESVPDESSLALHGYGTLSASQIVPRLTTLDRADLEAIARYERATRSRRTILNRIEQLLAQR